MVKLRDISSHESFTMFIIPKAKLFFFHIRFQSNPIFYYSQGILFFRTITLLISEDITGLQVLTREGKYVDLTKAEDPSYILVNVGAILERWTDNELIAARHRVVVNVNGITAQIQNGHENTDQVNGLDDDPVVCPKRQSFGFFVNADNEAVVKPLNNESSKYESMTTLEFLTEQINKIFKL